MTPRCNPTPIAMMVALALSAACNRAEDAPKPAPENLPKAAPPDSPSVKDEADKSGVEQADPGDEMDQAAEDLIGGAHAANANDKSCCKGLNECKGKGGCAVSGSHECAGHNACKGKGGCNMHCPK
jgi:hypothetical protein